MLGFCPDYLTEYLDARLIEDRAAQVTVLALNPGPAPVHYRVLCDLRLIVPSGVHPFRSPRLEPIVASATRIAAVDDVA